MQLLRPNLRFTACAALTVIGLWLLTQPYNGLRHDAVLYLAQAVRTFRPAQFEHDLFFAYGSQDSFSIYSLIFGPIFANAEVWPTQPLILLVCHAAFLAAVWRLLPQSMSLRERWLSMAALTLLRPAYGGMSIVGFCESFLTARSVAEPLALWSLVFIRRGQAWRAWAMLAAAAAFHPLMALGTALCLWLICCARDRRWLLLLLLVIPAAMLVVRDVHPFGGLLREYPANWWKLVTQANEQVLVKNWGSSDWNSILVDVLVLLGARHLLYRDKQFITAILAGCLSLLAVAVVGSQLYHNELITQMQLWRSLWVVRALAIALTPPLLLAIARKGTMGPTTACSIACLIGMANLHWSATGPAMAWPLLHLWIWRTGQPVSPRILRWSQITSVVALLAIGLSDYIGIRNTPIDDASFLDYSGVGVALVVLPMPILAGLAWLWRATRVAGPAGPHPGWPKAVAALAALLVIGGAAQWDRRTPLVRYMESHLHSTHPFEAQVPQGTQIYWDGDLAAAWFVLKRASYFTPPQGAGLLFNEKTAHEWGRRSIAFKPITQRRISCEFLTIMLGRLPVGSPPCMSLPKEDVAAVCRTVSELEFVVAPQRYDVPPLAVWEPPDGPEHTQTRYLYACSSLR